MSEDFIRYDVLVQDALRGVVRQVLTEVGVTGLQGEHHFYVTFATQAPGVRISSAIQQKYPEEMTIVIQHQFWDLIIAETHFEIKLSFDGTPERLLVPFSAIKGFFDPSVQFGLQFEPAMEQDNKAPETSDDDAPVSSNEEDAPAEKASETAESASTDEASEVISLDAFRKK